MADINTALAASREAIDQLIAAGERTGAAWTSPRAPGKWSPSQIVEHVARSLGIGEHGGPGHPSKFPRLPALIHPVARAVLFKRVLRNAAFPKAKTNKAMDAASGPTTPAEGRTRLETALQKCDEACRRIAARDGDRMQTTIFGSVPVEDYVRFMEIHARHPRQADGRADVTNHKSQGTRHKTKSPKPKWTWPKAHAQSVTCDL